MNVTSAVQLWTLKSNQGGKDVAGTKYYKVTEKELMALIATADSCEAMSGDLNDEAKRAQKAIKSIGKRHGVEFVRDYSVTEIKY